MASDSAADMKDRGERLAGARRSKGISQAALSEALGYTDHTMVGHVERGKKNMSARRWTAAARFLDTTVDYLDCHTDDPRGAANRKEGAMVGNLEKREITPEEAVENYQLILEEPMLALTVRRGALSIEDMADIADYIRLVQAEREEGG